MEQFDLDLRLVIQKALAGTSPKNEVLQEARDLKARMSRHVGELGVTMATLDQIMFKFARDPNWVWGWLPLDQAAAGGAVQLPNQAQRYDRGKRTLEIAAILAESATSVYVSDIIEALRAEGEKLGERPLATSVGNFLTRSGKWKRIDAGEYAPMDSNTNGASDL